MKNLLGLVAAILILSLSSPAHSETFDAVRDYTCDRVSAGVWHYEAFRAEDGKFLSMVFDRAQVPELSKYGADLHYLPDGDQPYYPFIARLSELICSPATKGRRFDAALTWVAPYKDKLVKVSGSTRLKDSVKGGTAGKVKARLQLNDKAVWEADLTGPEAKTFELKTPVSAGDRLSLCIQNTGDPSGNVTALDMRVETSKK